MYVAIVSSDKARAERLGERILDTCLSNGCYSTFMNFTADHGFLDELDKREFSTVVLTADGAKELMLAKSISDKKPNVKLILLGSDKAAVEGYSVNAHYCADAEPAHEDICRIADIIFPVA